MIALLYSSWTFAWYCCCACCRFLDQSGACSEEKFSYVPFGAGRHRCVGERFAYVQIKTIWSTLLRLFEFDLVDSYFPEVNLQTMIHTPCNPIIRYKRRFPTPSWTTDLLVQLTRSIRSDAERVKQMKKTFKLMYRKDRPVSMKSIVVCSVIMNSGFQVSVTNLGNWMISPILATVLPLGMLNKHR